MCDRDRILIERLTEALAKSSGALSGLVKGFGDLPEFKGLVDAARENAKLCDDAIRLVFPTFGKEDGAVVTPPPVTTGA